MNLFLEVAKMLGVPNRKRFRLDNNIPEEEAPVFWIDENGLQSSDTYDYYDYWHNILSGHYKPIPIDEEDIKKKKLQLCYVDFDTNVMYFTDNMAEVWGDDWNDAPYDCNAEPPYERYVKAKIAFDDINYYSIDNHIVKAPTSCSVQEINAGNAAWMSDLRDDWKSCNGKVEYVNNLMAGATYDEAIIWLRRAEIKWADFHD